MATYIITSGSNSFTFEVDGNLSEFPSGDLVPFVPSPASGQILKIRDKNHLLNSVGVLEKEILKIDLNIDTVTVDGNSTFPDAGSLFMALKPVFFLASGGGGGNEPLIPDNQIANTYADLPDPIDNDGQYWIVDQKTGTWILGTLKEAGIYKAVGGAWVYRGADVPYYLLDDQFTIKDSDDPTKQLGFQIDQISTGNRRVATWPDKDITVAGLSDIPVQSVFGRTGNVVSANDDYRSDQILVSTLDSNYFDFNFTGYGTLRDGDYRLQTTGVNLSNLPPQLTIVPAAIYNVTIKVNNNNWHSIIVNFSTQGDFNNQDREFKRSGQTFVAAQGIGWKENILQPLTVIQNQAIVLPGQTTIGLVNQQSNILETVQFQDRTFTPRRTGYHVLTWNFFASVNTGTQKGLYRLEIQGVISSDEARKEYKDSGGTGVILDIIQGNTIVGQVSSGTNTSEPLVISVAAILTEGVTYTANALFGALGAGLEPAVYNSNLIWEEKI